MSNQSPQLPQQRPTLQPPAQEYHSPFPSTRDYDSPSPSFLEPPTKRPRLSPNPPSPYVSHMNSPSMAHMSVPVSQKPYFKAPPQPWNQAQPMQHARPYRQETEIMGPPVKPEKPPDAKALNDLVYASGIDLNEEENYLAETYRNTHASTRQYSNAPPSTNGYNHYWNASYVGQNSLQPAGFQLRLPPPRAAPKTAEEIEDDRHKAAARRLAEDQQQHLSDPFLRLGAVRRTVQRRAYENGIIFNMSGLYDPTAAHQIQGRTFTSVLDRDAPLGDLLALVSLATHQRCRDLLEDAYAIARGRQTTADGAIPPEWSTIATPMPHSHEIDVVTTLRALARADRQREEARLKKREQRAARSSAGAATPGTPDATPAEQLMAPMEAKMSKKERDRLSKAGQTDEVLHQNTNVTVNKFLGNVKKYAWMTGDAGAARGAGAGASGASTPRGVGGGSFGGGGGGSGGGGAGGGSKIGGGGVPQNAALVARQNRMGEWREDGEKGRGVQIRDWISVLERDGRERKSLARAYVSLLERDQRRSQFG